MLSNEKLYEIMDKLGMVDLGDQDSDARDTRTQAEQFAQGTCTDLCRTMNFVDDLTLDNNLDRIKKFLVVLFTENKNNKYDELYKSKSEIDDDNMVIDHVDKWHEINLDGKMNIEPISNSFEVMRKFLKESTQEFIQERVNELEFLGWKLQPKDPNIYCELLFELLFKKDFYVDDPTVNNTETHYLSIYKDKTLEKDFVEKYTTRLIYGNYKNDDYYSAEVSLPLSIEELEIVEEIIHDPYWTEYKHKEGE